MQSSETTFRSALVIVFSVLFVGDAIPIGLGYWAMAADHSSNQPSLVSGMVFFCLPAPFVLAAFVVSIVVAFASKSSGDRYVAEVALSIVGAAGGVVTLLILFVMV